MVAALQCADRQLSLEHPALMGVLNITPDSFSDGGQLFSDGVPDLSSIVQRAQIMLGDGAAILDIGGESTRPGAAAVSIDEEMARVVPVVEALRGCDGVICVDTRNAQVARAAIDAGAQMINDVGGGRGEGMIAVIAQSDVAYCVMHMQGTPDTMQQAPQYKEVVAEVADFLHAQFAVARDAGIAANRLVLDPGIGFGKSVEQNISLINGLASLRAENCPILVGISRKSTLGAITGQPVESRMAASVTAAVLAAMRGANILRVHDVAATRDGLAVLTAFQEK